MPLPDYSRRILALAEVLYRWAAMLATLDGTRRRRVARYADEIAATLGRAAEAVATLDREPASEAAQKSLVREFGRIQGYLETIVGVLQRHLDGRKLAGVKRRLEQLRPAANEVSGAAQPAAAAHRLFAAEGYFRALADALRA